MKASLRERLLKHSIPEPNSGCWLWMGAVNDWGYGILKVNKLHRRAHRLSYGEFRGEIPAGKVVCHRCDMPPCINPDHLWLGDAKDNVADMVRKGRHSFRAGLGNPNLPRPLPGEGNHNARLTEGLVLAIRAATGSVKAIADQFGVPYSTAYNVRTRRHWRHI